jgi:hypothetical protein
MFCAGKVFRRQRRAPDPQTMLNQDFGCTKQMFLYAVEMERVFDMEPGRDNQFVCVGRWYLCKELHNID